MTTSTARVLALLEILQGSGRHTVPDLAARLGVDERTVRRYAGHLLDLGVPVESVRGRYGGYRLAPGYRMPPLMLTDEEALAVLLGLLSGRSTGPATTSAAANESAAAKIRRVLPKPLGRRLDALRETAGFTTRPRPTPPPETRILLELAEAARHQRPVTIHYTDRTARTTTRTVLPYGLVAHSGRWYLTAGVGGGDGVVGGGAASGGAVGVGMASGGAVGGGMAGGAAPVDSSGAADPAGSPGHGDGTASAGDWADPAGGTGSPAAGPAGDPGSLAVSAGPAGEPAAPADEGIRTFRLDRIAALTVQPGSFTVPPDFDPVTTLLEGLAQTPWAHEVSLRIHDSIEHIRKHLPAGVATLSAIPDRDAGASTGTGTGTAAATGTGTGADPGADPGADMGADPGADMGTAPVTRTATRAATATPDDAQPPDTTPKPRPDDSSAPDEAGDHTGWVHVRLRAERLDWIPPVLAALDRPFVIEHPTALRDLIRALARRLDEHATADGPPHPPI